MEASTAESTSSQRKPTYRVAVSLKIPECSSDNDDEEERKDESLRPKSCPHAASPGFRGNNLLLRKKRTRRLLLEEEKQLSLMRNQSNVELLTTPQRDQFDAFVSKCTGPWKDDLVHYPATEEDIESHPDVYDFEHAGVCQAMSAGYDEHPTMHGKASFIWINAIHCNTDAGMLRYNANLLDLLARRPSFQVHGGITGFNEGCVVFDCNHAMLDVTPFEPFTKTDEMQKIIGPFANTIKRRVDNGEGGEEDTEADDVEAGTLIPPPFFRQTIPGMNPGGSGRPRRSYKAYSFARRNLCSLADQFRAIADADQSHNSNKR